MTNWAWGLSLIAVTIAIHVVGLTFMVIMLHNIRAWLKGQRYGLLRVFSIVVAVITSTGLLLAALHGVEVALWAAAYLWLGAIASPNTAILYSTDSMATLGASGAMIQTNWHMMGALEAADGMLLFGVSTGFIFTVMQFYYQHLIFRILRGGRSRDE